MNQIIGLVTSFHLLAHCIFGCCAHQGAFAGTEPVSVTAGDNLCCEHSHQGTSYEPAESDSEESLTCSFDSPDRSHHDCPHAGCYWLDTKSDRAGDLDNMHLAGVQAAAAILVLHTPTVNTVVVLSDDSYAHAAAPAVRLHLAFGVLLI